MEIKPLFMLAILEQSQIAEARRLAAAAASSIGFDETAIGRLSIIVTELAGNLIKHTAKGGEIHIRQISLDGNTALEVISLDKGPGMRNISESMRDGYSTAGSPGTGLGSVSRLSDDFEIYSHFETGTVIFSRILNTKAPVSTKASLFDAGAMFSAKRGEDVSGDKWSIKQGPDYADIIVADGLGHGMQAAVASMEAVAAFNELRGYSPSEIMENIHPRLRPTRGAAVAVIRVNPFQNSILFCGIGNISGTLISGSNYRSMISHNGTMGHGVRKIQTFSYPWSNDSVLVLHSDGIMTRWNLNNYPGLLMKSPSLIAAVLYRDFLRGNDDATVVVVKLNEKNLNLNVTNIE